eukprot:m.37633 g.37633  ORF g.37633 m.37633 type:complete len:395 (-) comp5455_c0_seq1:76-1260(-)
MRNKMAAARLTALIVISCVAAALTASQDKKFLVGAIRWDAWYGTPPGNAGIVGRTTNYDLGPSRWHYRVPFFSNITGPNNVTINGDSDTVMAQEIEYATNYGIDYWAFCTYPIGCTDYHPPDSDCPYIQCCADNYALSYALLRYLRYPSPPVGFSLILQYNWFPGEKHGGNETLAQEIARYISYFRMPQYQRVAGNRPLVYLFSGTDPSYLGALAALMNATMAAGLPAPYYTYMGGDAQSAAREAKAYNASAISRYASIVDGSGAAVPFEENAQYEQKFWSDAATIGVDVIPPITAGWDPRPRFDYPVPWSPPQPQCGPVGDEKCYIQDPTMPQLMAQTAAAINFTLSHPKATPARTVLISAWNEHDEGHWVCPSLQDGPAKLLAIQEAIRQFD